MNKSVLTISLACVLFSAASLAAKSESAGQGKQNMEQIEFQTINAKASKDMDQQQLLIQQNKQQVNKQTQQLEHDKKELKNNVKSQTSDHVEKRVENKVQQEHKEMNKGSDMGQEKREENSKKWWKFWDEK